MCIGTSNLPYLINLTRTGFLQYKYLKTELNNRYSILCQCNRVAMTVIILNNRKLNKMLHLQGSDINFSHF